MQGKHSARGLAGVLSGCKPTNVFHIWQVIQGGSGRKLTVVLFLSHVTFLLLFFLILHGKKGDDSGGLIFVSNPPN